MSKRFTYYDARSVLQRGAMEMIAEWLKPLGPVDVAKFPSGHKVWRVTGLGKSAPIVEFIKDDEHVRIEPSTECSLEPMLSDWVEVHR